MEPAIPDSPQELINRHHGRRSPLISAKLLAALQAYEVVQDQHVFDNAAIQVKANERTLQRTGPSSLTATVRPPTRAAARGRVSSAPAPGAAASASPAAGDLPGCLMGAQMNEEAPSAFGSHIAWGVGLGDSAELCWISGKVGHQIAL